MSKQITRRGFIKLTLEGLAAATVVSQLDLGSNAYAQGSNISNMVIETDDGPYKIVRLSGFRPKKSDKKIDIRDELLSDYLDNSFEKNFSSDVINIIRKDIGDCFNEKTIKNLDPMRLIKVARDFVHKKIKTEYQKYNMPEKAYLSGKGDCSDISTVLAQVFKILKETNQNSPNIYIATHAIPERYHMVNAVFDTEKKVCTYMDTAMADPLFKSFGLNGVKGKYFNSLSLASIYYSDIEDYKRAVKEAERVIKNQETQDVKRASDIIKYSFLYLKDYNEAEKVFDSIAGESKTDENKYLSKAHTVYFNILSSHDDQAQAHLEEILKKYSLNNKNEISYPAKLAIDNVLGACMLGVYDEKDMGYIDRGIKLLSTINAKNGYCSEVISCASETIKSLERQK